MELKPTPEQEAIIEAARDRTESIMISAYAGCAKTTTLEMLARVLPKRSSLAVAFNVKIKKELERRFPGHFTVMTLNGLGHRAWARTLGGMGVKGLNVDDKKLGKIVGEEIKKAQADQDLWVPVRDLVSKAMQLGLTPAGTRPGWLEDTEQTWRSIAEDNWIELDEGGVGVELARRALQRSVQMAFEGIISFDEQIYMPIFFGGQFQRFDIVLVDEAQDLSPLNHEQIERVAGKEEGFFQREDGSFGWDRSLQKKKNLGRLIVCGDPKQAIYAFRGADSDSMGKMKRLREEWIELPLATTFRCPQLIVERQQHHAPGFTAAPQAPRGQWEKLPRSQYAADSGHEIEQTDPEKERLWQLGDLPSTGQLAILCRNNAPLLSMAFKLIRLGQGVQMLGRDIGRGLISLSEKICKDNKMPAEEVRARIETWRMTERSKALANGDDGKVAGIEDRAECLLAVLDSGGAETAGELRQKLVQLFEKETGRITLATGHRAKGLEWETVVHLDPFRIPSRFARENPKQMEQEMNLKYVIETRTKKRLIEAKLEEFEI